MASSFKKTQVILELLTDIGILLMVEKGIRGGICHTTNRYGKANNRYMREYDKNKRSPYLKYWKKFIWLVTSQKLPVTKLERIEDSSQFNEDLIQNCNEEKDEGYLLEVDIQYTEKLHELHN